MQFVRLPQEGLTAAASKVQRASKQQQPVWVSHRPPGGEHSGPLRIAHCSVAHRRAAVQHLSQLGEQRGRLLQVQARAGGGLIRVSAWAQVWLPLERPHQVARESVQLQIRRCGRGCKAGDCVEEGPRGRGSAAWAPG